MNKSNNFIFKHIFNIYILNIYINIKEMFKVYKIEM
jgi:hypothetical protein